MLTSLRASSRMSAFPLEMETLKSRPEKAWPLSGLRRCSRAPPRGCRSAALPSLFFSRVVRVPQHHRREATFKNTQTVTLLGVFSFRVMRRKVTGRRLRATGEGAIYSEPVHLWPPRRFSEMSLCSSSPVPTAPPTRTRLQGLRVSPCVWLLFGIYVEKWVHRLIA